LLAWLRSGAAGCGHPRLGIRAGIKDVDGRDEPGHGGGESFSAQVITPLWIDRQAVPRYAKAGDRRMRRTWEWSRAI
jgi:hypothetical protein